MNIPHSSQTNFCVKSEIRAGYESPENAYFCFAFCSSCKNTWRTLDIISKQKFFKLVWSASAFVSSTHWHDPADLLHDGAAVDSPSSNDVVSRQNRHCVARSSLAQNSGFTSGRMMSAIWATNWPQTSHRFADGVAKLLPHSNNNFAVNTALRQLRLVKGKPSTKEPHFLGYS